MRLVSSIPNDSINVDDVPGHQFVLHDGTVVLVLGGEIKPDGYRNTVLRIADLLSDGSVPADQRHYHQTPAEWLVWLDGLPTAEREHAAERVGIDSHAAWICRSDAHGRWVRQLREALVEIRQATEKGLAQ